LCTLKGASNIEYKVVDVDVLVTADWKNTLSGEKVKYLSTQDALNEYGKNGWELISASYWHENNQRTGRLIFGRK
jgi:hypothetical protein